MNRSVTVCVAVLLTAAGALSVELQGQTPAPPAPPMKKTAAPRKAVVSRTIDGHPDLTGIWSFATTTPFERPADLADKEFLTPKEAADYAKKVVAQRDKDKREGGLSDVESAYNDFWWDQGTDPVGTFRTSLVIEPKDGHVPPLTPEGKARGAAAGSNWLGAPAGPEDRSLGERCIMGFNAGPPMVPSAYNNNVHIFQTPTQIGFLNEMVHNARIVAVDGRPHLPSSVRQWAGDPRGHWEGDTLVIETTNFRAEGTGSIAVRETDGRRLKLTERFTRRDANTLIYEFTVDDPTTWTKPWVVQVPMTRFSQPMYEYACHEGNHAMINMLSGARAQGK
jgi:hypothetical protein